MEDLLMALFQFFFEVIVQLLAEVPWDLSLGISEKRSALRDGEPNYIFWGFGSLFAGAALGGASLLVHPHTVITNSWARVAYLFFAPFSAWLFSYFFSKYGILKRTPEANPKRHAACLFLFSFGLTVIRFMYADRH